MIPQAETTSQTNKQVKKYYDLNTPIFIKIGRSSASANIHRAVWGEGVSNEEEAMTYVNKVILDEIETIDTGEPLKILDLGCGVGAPIFYLAKRIRQEAKFTGVSISGVQIDYAKKFHQREHAEANCEFIEADFHKLPELPPQDLIFLVEAFIHSNNPEKLLQGIQNCLKPGGKLIICDDFLNPDNSVNAGSKKFLKDFIQGWQVGSLWQVQQIKAAAEKYDLTLTKNTDLTPYLNLWTLRDKIAHFFLYFYKLLPVKSTYWESILGGDSLQKCLINGLINYRFLVFIKNQER